MIKPGLCSVSFRSKTPAEIISLASQAGLTSIEWASDSHVREGDVTTAKEVRKMTEDAGLEVSSYGSYFRIGLGTDIVPYLESAKALGAKEIRIWGGPHPSKYMFFYQRQSLVREAREISDIAADYGITLSTECHSATITDTPESLLFFMFEVNKENFRTYWQPLLHIPEEEQMNALKAVYASGKLTNLHTYQIKLNCNTSSSHLISEGYDEWLERFSIFKDDKTVRHALIEFVKNSSDESFFSDAKTLIELCNKVNN
ncbi:MAG: sugar phosphate isomerase/epimerase [Oscillospiraceae bacterium]|nr:sugar phosphate isomerase/epimerase [Oscillospiraceae bacterium]